MTKIRLSEISTKAPDGLNKGQAKKEIKALTKEFAELQNTMHAQSKYGLLIVFQGMDASGKDGVARTVFSEVSPSGVLVKSFKKPTDEEMSHDFLWRVHKNVPARGMIQVFNRSHYEDVLIQRVHQWIDEDKVQKRFDHINNFESLLQENGVRVLKFYLHVSKEKQIERLEERKTDPRKHWKHNDNDFKERLRWDDYMDAYEDVFEKCGPEIPWTIVPADQNWAKSYVVLKRIVEELRSLPLEYPGLKKD